MKKYILIISFILSASLFLPGCSLSETKGGGEPALSQEKAEPVRLSLYPAMVNYLSDRKWGYINSAGEFAIPPEYTDARRFQANDLAVAGKNGKEGLIDRTGRFVVEPVYQNIGEFSDGLAIVQDEGGFSVMDAQGRILSDRMPFIGTYKEGRAAYYVETQGGRLLYGYLGEDGRTAIEPAYESAGSFDGGIAVAKLPESNYVIIDRTGKRLKTLKYNYVMNVSDGMIPFVPTQDGKYGFLDSKGEVAIEPAFLNVEGFRNGTAVVNASSDYLKNRMGLIDKKGKYLVKPQYNDILQLGEERVALGLVIDPKNPFAGSKYALGATDGTILSDFSFYGVEPFQDGVASAYNNTSTFFIDKQGKKVESLPTAEGIGRLELLDSLVYADVDSRPYYMNRQGEIIYRPADSVKLKSGVEVSEEKFRPNRNYLVYYPVLGDLKDLKVQETINAKLRDMWTDTGVKPTDNLDYSYEGNFSIGFHRKNLLELQKSAYDYPFGAAHGMPIMEYAHVDTKTGAFYRLEDLFRDGSNYAEVLSRIVEKQIREHGEEMGVWPDSYKGVKPDQPFYLSGDALMLYFEPYEIAPYAAGFPTFTVPFAEISDIIDKKGSFWLSFN